VTFKGAFSVPCVALGTLQLGVNYPTPRMSRDEGIALVRAAYAGGVRLFDTSDAYCKNGSEMGYVEELLAAALKDLRDAVVATKGGMTRHASNEASNNTWGRPVGSPERIEQLIADSSKRLGGPIQLWQVHHVDEAATVKVMTAAKKMQSKGLIQHLGVVREQQLVIIIIILLISAMCLWDSSTRCVTPTSTLCLFRTSSTSGLVRPQARSMETPKLVVCLFVYLIWFVKCFDVQGKTGTVDFCSKHGLVFMAYSPLGGLKTRRNERDLVADFPQFAVEAKKRNVDP
jgi:aryl-alcohol dehydrogenase-like predicted oxidoreductase